jgi:hypothetical protein
MKKVILFSLLSLTAIFYSGCKKRSIVEFDMNYSTDFVVAAGTATPGVNYYWSTFNTDISKQLDNYKLNGNIVGEVTCDFFEVKVKGSSGANLNVMKDYEFFVDAGEQKEVRMAHCSPWMSPTPTQTIMSSASISTTINPVQIKIDGESCETDGVSIANCPLADRKYDLNLKNYFMEPNIQMKMKVYPHTTVPTTYTLTATFRVHVKGIE